MADEPSPTAPAGLRKGWPVALATAGLLLVAFLLDVFLVPTVPLLLYSVPLLFTARYASWSAVLVVGGVALLLSIIAAFASPTNLANAPWHWLTLALLTGLSALLARHIVELEETRRRAERARREAELARESLQRFLAMVAHDLRQPLTAILGFAQLAQRPDAAPSAREQALARVQTYVRQMDRILADLGQAAALGSGAFPIEPRPTDLVALVRETVETFQAGSPAHRIELEALERLEGVWDADRLRQVLANLIGNAVKYSPDGGKVLVRVERAGRQAVVTVSDEGLGIAPEELPTLFQPFARLERDRRIGGTGLGLYICQGIARAHGGEITAASAGLGQGATFSLKLPLNKG
jgi:signal transduction histidine kinase